MHKNIFTILNLKIFNYYYLLMDEENFKDFSLYFLHNKPSNKNQIKNHKKNEQFLRIDDPFESENENFFGETADDDSSQHNLNHIQFKSKFSDVSSNFSTKLFKANQQTSYDQVSHSTLFNQSNLKSVNEIRKLKILKF